MSVISGCASAYADPGNGAAHHASNFNGFDKTVDAKWQIETVKAVSAETGKLSLVMMGANWCHDSEALYEALASPELSNFIADNFNVAFVDVGQKDRNLDIARSFGLDGIKGTPTVILLSPEGEVLNLESAVAWRNSANRSNDDIRTELQSFLPKG